MSEAFNRALARDMERMEELRKKQERQNILKKQQELLKGSEGVPEYAPSIVVGHGMGPDGEFDIYVTPDVYKNHVTRSENGQIIGILSENDIEEYKRVHSMGESHFNEKVGTPNYVPSIVIGKGKGKDGQEYDIYITQDVHDNYLTRSEDGHTVGIMSDDDLKMYKRALARAREEEQNINPFA